MYYVMSSYLMSSHVMSSYLTWLDAIRTPSRGPASPSTSSATRGPLLSLASPHPHRHLRHPHLRYHLADKNSPLLYSDGLLSSYPSYYPYDLPPRCRSLTARWVPWRWTSCFSAVCCPSLSSSPPGQHPETVPTWQSHDVKREHHIRKRDLECLPISIIHS